MFEIVLEATGGVVVAIALLVILLLVSFEVTSYIYDLNKVEGYTNYEKDLIYLHTFPRACCKQVPNLSPYAIKLETWLRLHKLKYKVVETYQFSKKGQIPFIVFNGEQTADSQLTIEYLSKYFSLDQTEGLSPQLQSASRAFRVLIENSFSWTCFCYRYVHHYQLFKKVHQLPRGKILNTLSRLLLKWGVKKNSCGAGIGRHTPQDIYDIGADDIRAISHFLGDKKYLCGDKITVVDCAVFGQLVQVSEVKTMPYPQRDVIESDCPNVRLYLDRIKEQLWPDWTALTQDGEFE
ncbi:Failed axon connections protein [Lamellibrachia satsuma]|nr:Failed axon connections protein [Lamellibrachia satsuma]